MLTADDQGRAFNFALNGVVKVPRPDGREKFLCVISAAQIHELLVAGKVRPSGPVALDRRRVNNMVDRILGNTWHGGALTWNLRPDEVEVAYDEHDQRLYILHGKPTIPDSYQRHEAITKAVDRTGELGLAFDPEQYAMPLIIENLDADGEVDLNIEYNLVTSRSTNRARRKSPRLMLYPNQMVNRIMEMEANAEEPIFSQASVELATDNLSRSSAKVATFSTLARGIELGFPSLNDDNFQEIARFLQEFLPCLAKALPELKRMSRKNRGTVRGESIVDSGIMIQSYLRLAGHLWDKEVQDWPHHVARLGQPHDEFPDGKLMSRNNPLWERQKVLVPNNKGEMVLSKGLETSEAVYKTLLHTAELN